MLIVHNLLSHIRKKFLVSQEVKELSDISSWERVGYGGKSTLDKEELIDPVTKDKYLIKYPRIFKVGISWEDITELISTDIGKLLGLEMMDVEIVVRNGRQGSLLKNFIPNGVMNEEGGSLLSMMDDYDDFVESSLKGEELIELGFRYVKQLYFWNEIKRPFIEMNYFDILIGNQDRHPFNWMILFESADNPRFSTIYDNGASLGFSFEDNKLMNYIQDKNQLEKYMRKSTVKAGLFEKNKVKSIEMIKYLKEYYTEESALIIKRIIELDLDAFYNIVDSYSILSEIQKHWLKLIISFRRENILKWIGEEA